MSSFTKLGLAALLSTTASALAPRQTPSNPTCFNLEAMAEGQSFNGEFVYIIPNPARNYTTGLQGSQAQGTVFTLTDFTNDTAGALFAVNAPGTPAQRVPLLPNDQTSAPISWFNMMDAQAAAGSVTSLRCEAQVSTGYLTCAGVEQFNICSGTVHGTRGTEVPAGCEVTNLLVMPTECPFTTSSSMGFNNTMSSTSMMSTAMPITNATMTSSSSGVLTNTLIPLRPTAPSTIGTWSLLGCANSLSGFLGWVQVASTPIMTEECCTVFCANYRYGGTNGANCYCATELQDVSTTTFPDSCTVPCPGNASQACGGAVPRNGTFPSNSTVSALRNTKRQRNLQALLLTTYVNLAFDAQPPSNININLDIIVYVDVCDTCAGGLATFTTTSILSTTACGCPTKTLRNIPLTTVTRPCVSCCPSGGSSIITVTIPVDANTTRTQTLPGGGACVIGGVTPAPFTTSVVFTGQARREIGGLVGAIAAGFFAMLG